MTPIEQHRRIVGALIWLIVIVGVATLTLSAAVFVITAADEATRSSIETYHLRTLNVAREIDQVLDLIDSEVTAGERPAAPAIDIAALKGAASAIARRVEEVTLLQQRANDPGQAEAVARVKRRLDRLLAVADAEESDNVHGLIDSLRLAMTQLEKLHIMRADQLIQGLELDRGRQTALLIVVAVAILGVSVILFMYVYRSLSTTLRQHLETRRNLESTEQRLRDSEKLQALGQLVGGIAHDFNNLLMAINGYTELISLDRQLSANTRAHLGEVMDAGTRAAGLTRQLLAFGRQQPVEKRRVDLNALVTSTESMLKTFIQDDVEMRITLERWPMVVEIDPRQVEQLLTNLTINARDAISGGGTISVSTAEVSVADEDDYGNLAPGRYCRLTVMDDGCGMDEQTVSKAFDPFFTTKPIGDGTGLGLSTVHGIVSAHDGLVLVDSEVDRGTRFDIYLPRCDESTVPAAQESEQPVVGGTETLLLVEDERQIRELTSAKLSQLGYEVLVANDGSDAIRISRERPGSIDLIVSDVIMPGMTGPEAVAQVIDEQPEAVVVYVSGYTDDVVLRTGIASSRADLLHKPFKLDELARLIRSGLDARRARSPEVVPFMELDRQAPGGS